MTKSQVRERARVAHSFLKAAQDLHTLADDDHSTNPVASNAILSGIAASDVICAVAIGKYSQGEAHAVAIQLLKSVAPNGPTYAKDLKRLVDAKATVQYSARLASGTLASDCLRWAERLVTAMDVEMRGIGT